MDIYLNIFSLRQIWYKYAEYISVFDNDTPFHRYSYRIWLIFSKHLVSVCT